MRNPGIVLRGCLVAFLVSGSITCGCTGPDLRARMLESCQAQKWFPDGKTVKLTSFAYVGTVQSPEGPIRVGYYTAVLTGMLAPRGQAGIIYFDAHGRYLGVERPSVSQAGPLWTNGPLLMLYGDALPLKEELQTDPDGVRMGNAIDFSKGFARREVVQRPAYGSSSGPYEYTERTGDRDISNPEGRPSQGR